AFLPIANWIPGGHEASWYPFIGSGFLSGTTIALGVGVVLAILSGKIGGLWREGAVDRVVGLWTQRPVLVTLAIATVALALYTWVAINVLGGRPLLIDEVVELFQAQIYASGSLSLPAFPHPEFFSGMHLVDTQGRVYSQFPAGGPAMLALGVLLHSPWLVGPFFATVGVVAFAAYARRTERRQGVALAATLIFAFAPFAVFMSGSHMNHVTTLAWVMIAVAALAGVMTSEKPRPAMAAVAGFGFGMAATIRPVDALAFALPAGIWFLVRALRDRRRWLDAIPAGIGVAVPMLALMWVNTRTTGSPLLFGYEVLWGKSHRLGFHSAPWGMSHTPARGLELINIYFLRLQTYFLESPVPSLVPAIGALALSRRLDRFDRYLLTSSALLIGLYFAYWHDGFYLGPRFMYLLLVPLAIWTARLYPLLRERVGSGLVYRSVVYASLCAILIALFVDIPIRTRQYSNGLLTMRWNADSSAAASGVQNALVLVRESWGAQLVSRLWAIGVPRSETELLYRRVDACALNQAVGTLEASKTRGVAALEALRPLLGDSARLVGSPVSPDTTEQYLLGSKYSADCVARIADDRQGFTLFTPLLLAHGGGNIYARDLHGRDTLLVHAFPNRPLFLLKPATAKIGEPPRFYPISRDSLERAWHDATR
ncbi:MAG TPA: hypothetical protein VIQ74_08905, partial [Gemmatimonadaceae bacterium]